MGVRSFLEYSIFGSFPLILGLSYYEDTNLF